MAKAIKATNVAFEKAVDKFTDDIAGHYYRISAKEFIDWIAKMRVETYEMAARNGSTYLSEIAESFSWLEMEYRTAIKMTDRFTELPPWQNSKADQIEAERVAAFKTGSHPTKEETEKPS